MKRMFVPQLAAALVGLALTATAAHAQHHVKGGQHCAPPCCDEIKTVCRPEVGTKKTTKYWYNCKCEDLCIPKCTCSGCSFNLASCFRKGCKADCCEPCPAPTCNACAECECPRVVKKLIKYPKVVEECDFKCVPEKVLVPVCPKPCSPGCYGPPPHGAIIAAPAAPAKPAGEMLPPPKTEKP